MFLTQQYLGSKNRENIFLISLNIFIFVASLAILPTLGKSDEKIRFNFRILFSARSINNLRNGANDFSRLKYPHIKQG